MSAEMETRVEMVSIEVDGITLEVPKGSMIIEATDKAGIDIPRFCYHKKLSIAANCRMCLVDVEKAPKPLPACATPVVDGMKVYTESRRAIDAQHGVMEFLLINHPLDCPICDQGGECELQDLAMGYGRSVSRFTERKRVIEDKNLGPLVQSDMTRCIHCTRCVRFLEEITGTSEMGGAGRADAMEIGTIVERSIDSELSGNIIDLCPVGALTDKPFRYRARAWEMDARPSVGCHDGVGSLVYHHALRGRILRTVPRENEKTNEVWLSDRDRYSRTGLYAEDRVVNPRLKRGGEWIDVSWDEAIAAAVEALRGRGEQLGLLMSPSVATEEYYLAQKLARGLGSHNIDHRLRECDFRDDPARPADPAFEMRVADMERADTVLLVGSNIRNEAPILGHRLRKAWLGGAKIHLLNPLDWPFEFKAQTALIAAPQNMVAELAAIAAAVEGAGGKKAPQAIARVVADAKPAIRKDHEFRRIAESLVAAKKGLVLLGQAAMSHPEAALLRRLAAYIADAGGCAFNLLPHGANPVGAWRAGAVPHRVAGAGESPAGGLDAAAMLSEPRQAYLLWALEPEFDIDNPSRALRALAGAEHVVAAAEFASGSLLELADVLLPLAPVAESEGGFVNLDGDELRYQPAGRPSGEVRPGWKILRRLGAELGLDGFAQVNLEELLAEMSRALGDKGFAPAESELGRAEAETGLFRVGEVPLYSVDALCRRATPLQSTVQADSASIALSPADAESLRLAEGDRAKLSQPSSGDAAIELPVRISSRVPAGAAWLRSATCSSRSLGTAMGAIRVEKA